MKINSEIKIVGTKVILVPYKKKHVEKYHQWMKNEELLELTASEPLTLQEEYAMQQSWYEDPDKCTFIVLDKEIMDKTNDEIGSMIGDVNLYLNDKDDSKVAEIEIMIADVEYRSKGRGKEALLLMMLFGVCTLHLSKFVAKIKMKNKISFHLFSKVGFKEVGKSDIFQEIEMVCEVDEAVNDLLHTLIYEIKEY